MGTPNVGSIGAAFINCKELTDVYCHLDELPKTSEDAFKDSYVEYATLHVPYKSLDDYKTTVPWSSFGKIVPLDEPNTPEDPQEPDTPDEPQNPSEPAGENQGTFLKYFIDVDPGYRKATIVKEIGAGNNELEFELGSTQPGAHMLYVRTKDKQHRQLGIRFTSTRLSTLPPSNTSSTIKIPAKVEAFRLLLLLMLQGHTSLKYHLAICLLVSTR